MRCIHPLGGIFFRLLFTHTALSILWLLAGLAAVHLLPQVKKVVVVAEPEDIKQLLGFCLHREPRTQLP
jgi:hypothetical protein